MSGPVVLAIAVFTVVCALVAMITRRLHLGGGALVGVGAGAGTLLFLTGEPGLGVAALACTWGVAAAGQVVGQAVSRAEEHRDVPRSRAPWLVALLATAILAASLGLGVGAVDWADSPPRSDDGHEEAGRGAWALAVLGVAAALALARFAPREEDR